MKSETWKDVVGFEGLYRVSNYGNVTSLNYKHTGKEKAIYITTDRNGYKTARLCKDKKYYRFCVHTLVGKAFIYNPNNYTEINHKDENKGNNFYENLEWCTRVYNMRYNDGIKRRVERKRIEREKRLYANRQGEGCCIK